MSGTATHCYVMALRAMLFIRSAATAEEAFCRHSSAPLAATKRRFAPRGAAQRFSAAAAAANASASAFAVCFHATRRHLLSPSVLPPVTPQQSAAQAMPPYATHAPEERHTRAPGAFDIAGDSTARFARAPTLPPRDPASQSFSPSSILIFHAMPLPVAYKPSPAAISATPCCPRHFAERHAR